ncbi:HD domain-containing protein [Actinophytocola sediminis]
MSDPDLSLPTTELAQRAHALVTEAQQPFLRNHSVRGFLFARAAATHEDYDAELVFLICVLHDMGLTEQGNTDQRFEVAGADLAARFLEEHGVTDRRVDTVWEAIALHTSPQLHESPVFQRRRPIEIGIAQTGIGIDIGGPDDPDQLPGGFAERVHTHYPRLGGSRALTEAIVEQALTNPLKAPPTTLPGEIVHQRHPSVPYLTWNMILDANAWGD